MERIRTLELWFYKLKLDEIRDWFLRIYHCHHNARVLCDTEYRLSCVLCHATGGKMSKSGYDWETMQYQINQYHQELYEQGYEEAKKELGLIED